MLYEVLKCFCSTVLPFRQLPTLTETYSQKRPQLYKMNANVHCSDHYVHMEAGLNSSVGVVD